MTIKLLGEDGNPKGDIKDYNFPESGVVGVEYPYSIVVQNIGGEGTYGCGVVNSLGNPGLIRFVLEDRDININQGEYLRSSETGPYGSEFTSAKKMVFTVPGTYIIPLWEMYLGQPGSWYYDVETTLSIVIAEVPIEKTAWERFKDFAREHPYLVAASLGSVVVGGAAYAGGVVAKRKES